MALKWSAIHPIRLMASLLLAGTLGYLSYHLAKPQTFSYARLHANVTAESGTTLTAEQVEEAVLPLDRFSSAGQSPVPGLIPWTQIRSYLGTPLARRVEGGEPLLANDFVQSGAGGLSQPLSASMTGMSIPVDNVTGVTPFLSQGDKVHVYASFQDENGAHTGLLLRNMPVLSLQREMDGDVPSLVAVTIALKMDEAVYLAHALHFGKVRLAKAAAGETLSGIGDQAFAAALIKTKKRWTELEEGRK